MLSSQAPVSLGFPGRLGFDANLGDYSYMREEGGLRFQLASQLRSGIFVNDGQPQNVKVVTA